ncbi:uncharacterized protein LOC109841771 [Asparagus officinalis]|uniref:uncharacterized protein LOC109841771 n=1 Tax=Asparagus officinalis TaxID=4686 RepID=UPI00098E6FE5|nr:uncharacterized protein LOC109841771 [Asparagus officinalis]
MPQKSVKGQAICDLMASHPLEKRTDLFEDLPDETPEVNTTFPEEVWQLFFDGASYVGTSWSIIAGEGVVLISPQNHVLPWAFSLMEPCTNNVAEYNALLIGLELAKKLGIKHLETYGDSQLNVIQMTGEYEVRNDDLILLHKTTIKLAESFESFLIEHVIRSKNTHADALASLAANLAQPLEMTQCVIVASRRLFWPEDVLDVNTTHQASSKPNPKDWRFPIIDYILYGILPEDVRERESIRKCAARFYYDSATKTLYRRSYDDMLLRCPGMVSDAVAYARSCHSCQIHANYMHRPPEDLHPTATSWPIKSWGMDIIGPISPPSARGHRFIQAITDYFSK